MEPVVVEILGVMLVVACLAAFVRSMWHPRENTYADRDNDFTDGGQG